MRAITTDIGHFVRDDEMVLGIDRDLDVVADNAGAAPLVAIERESGSVSDIC